MANAFGRRDGLRLEKITETLTAGKRRRTKGLVLYDDVFPFLTKSTPRRNSNDGASK